MNGFIEKDLIDESLFVDGNDNKKVFVHDKERNIFVMNDHGLAFYCWQKFFKKENDNKILLVHIDYHADADLVDKKESINDITENDDVSYIANTYSTWINSLNIFSIKNNYNVKIISLIHENDFGNAFGQGCEKFEVKNFSNKQEKLFFKYLKNKNIDILDVDLDYFLDVNSAQNVFTPWSEEKINNFFLNLFSTIKYPKIITVATSPGCMGTEYSNAILSEKSKSIYKFIEKNLHKYYSYREL